MCASPDVHGKGFRAASECLTSELMGAGCGRAPRPLGENQLVLATIVPWLPIVKQVLRVGHTTTLTSRLPS